ELAAVPASADGPGTPVVQGGGDVPGRGDVPATAEARAPGGVAGAADSHGAGDGQTTQVRPSLVAPIRDQCSACGAPMAPDQRYCVECGQRRGPARGPPLEGLSERAAQAPPARRPRRARPSVNATLIAGIGTLLLAMGVGVLIGRSGNNSSAKAPPAQVVTVAGGGGAAGTAATPGAATSTAPKAAGASKAPKSLRAAAEARAKAAAKAAAPQPTVKIG